MSHILINSPTGFLFDKLSMSNISVMLSEPSMPVTKDIRTGCNTDKERKPPKGKTNS